MTFCLDSTIIKPEEDKKIKVIAGKFENAEGPIKKHNVEPIFFDVELKQNKLFSFSIPKSHNSFVYLVDGRIKIGNLSHDNIEGSKLCLLYTSPSPRDGLLSRMPSSA